MLTTILPALFVTILPGLPRGTAFETGLSLLASVMFVIFAVQYPQQPFFFGIPAWVLALVFVGIDVLRYVGDRLWGQLLLLLSAIAVGVVTVRQWGYAERLEFVPRLSSGQKRPAPKRQKTRKPRRSSGKATVVDGPWADAPAPPSSADSAAAQAELDALLDKISASGLDSLSNDEKRRLNELSKRLR